MTTTTSIAAQSFAQAVAFDSIPSEPPFAYQLLEHRHALLGFANLLTGNRAAAEDLLQDTLERALAAADRFKAGTNLGGWLRRIMRNRFIDGCRERRTYVDIDSHEFLLRPVEIDREAEATPADGYLSRFTVDDVASAAGRLSSSLKDVFILAHIKNQSHQAIAAELGIPAATVGTRLWRARARIRQVLIGRT